MQLAFDHVQLSEWPMYVKIPTAYLSHVQLMLRWTSFNYLYVHTYYQSNNTMLDQK